MKYKKLIFFIALLVLLVGVVNAADASDNETVADTADIIDSSTDTQSPIQTDVIEKKNNEIKPLKEASTSQTYNVTDYDTLKSALTDESYDKVNVNIKSHITLAGSISLSDSISSLKINGYGKTINGNNEYKLFTIKSDANTAINITNLKIINCYSSYGAIEKNGGTLTLKNVTFMNNKAEYGGAIDNYGGGKLTISQSTFTNNIATGNGGAIRSKTDLSISSSKFINNSADEKGGAIYNQQGTLTINNCKFTDNSASTGNTIYVDEITNIKNSVIVDQSDDESESVYDNGDITLTNTTINVRAATKLALKLSNSTPEINQNITITATLSDMNNTKLANQTVIITINDETYTLQTNNKGVASRNITITRTGNQTVSAKFDGTEKYAKTSTTSTISVPKTSKTFNVKNYTDLYEALTSKSYDDVTVNIKADIKLNDNITLSTSIDTLKINGYGKTINGNNENKFFTIPSDSGTVITLSNMKITKCYSKYGAIEKNGGTLTIKNVTFINNKAEYGGAIENYGGEKLTISQSTFTNNSATENGGAIRSRTDLSISSSKFINNSADEKGGAISNEQNSVTINKCIFTDNSAYKGNTIYVDGTANIKNSIIYDQSEYDSESLYDDGDITLTNTTINVKDATKLALKLSNSTPKINQNITITATLSDMNNTKLANQPITLTINDETYTLQTNNNGVITKTITITAGGTQTINATYKGYEKYARNSTAKKITVPKIDTTLTLKVSNSTPNVNDKVKIAAILTDSDKKYVAKQDITLTVNNEKYTIRTSANGVATYYYKTDTLGKITINAKYNGTTSTYNPSNTTTKITVKGKYDTNIDLAASSFAPIVNTSVDITATLSDQKNNKIANQQCILTVNNKNYTIKTDANGTITKTVKMTSVGTNPITVTYNGNTTCAANKDTLKIFVRDTTGTDSKARTIVSLKASTLTPGLTENVTFTATLTDLNKNRLAGGKIVFHINNQNYTLRTDSNGVATQNYTPTKVGTSTITVKYTGSTTYYGNKTTLNISHGNIYVTSDGTGNGRTRENPTNITHALEIVNDNEIINLVTDSDSDTYTEEIDITTSTVKEGTSIFTITGEKNKEIIIANELYNSYYIDLTVKNLVFKGNNSQLSGRNFLVRNCTFMDCENSAIYVDDDAIIEKNSFINNHGSYGGAIYVYGSNVIIRNNIFKYNTAIWGGAIYLTRADNCVIENNKFTQNEADKQGGAIELKGSSNIEIKNNTFLGNKANYGGAIDNFREYGSYTYTSTYYTTETRLESYWNPMHHQIPGSSTPIFGYNGMIVGYQTNYIWVGQTEYRTVTVQVPHTQTNTAWRYYGGDNVITNNQFIENCATTHGSAITNNMTGTIISANTFKINNAGETGKAIINTTEITNKNNVNESNSAYSSTIYTKENTNITSNKFTTGLKTTVITINEIKPVQYSDNVTITGTVTNVDYKAFSNAQLTLKINGETVSVKTNNKGVFTYTYKTSTIGQNNISVTYAGNSKYAKATQKLTFDVIRKDTVITLNKINNTKKSSNAVITGKITSSSGVILKNVDVVIKINNKKFTVKSDSKGVFTYSYKTTTVGTNNVTVSYAGNSRYADVTKTSSFKVTEA